jgi:hypothetical protein
MTLIRTKMLLEEKCTKSKNTRTQYNAINLMLVVLWLVIATISILSNPFDVNVTYGQGEVLVKQDTNTTSISSDPMDDPNVAFKSNLEQIAGHLNAALLNKESGNNTLALAHAFHPIAEIYSLIEPTIARTNSTLNHTLSAELTNITGMVRFVSSAQFSDAVHDAKRLLNQTSDAVIPSQLKDNLAFNMKVAIDLLNTAVGEYAEAISNNSIAELVEYQNAQAFISRGIERAESIFEQESSDIPANISESVQGVNAMFSNLENQALSISSPESVSSTTQGIVRELSKIAGIRVEGGSPDLFISNIRGLLDQVTTAYGNQNYSQAESLATEAYLDNYEYIEAPLADLDKSLMESTEVMLREDLRQQIQDRVPLQEIQQQIGAIFNNLNDAEKLLAEMTS